MKKSRHRYALVIDFLHFRVLRSLRARAKEESQMPRNATVQIKTLTPRQAVNRVNENLRLGTKFTSQDIVVLEDNLASTSFSPEKKERSNEDKEIGQKINALRASIKTYQKRISQTTDEKKITKMQNKILGYEDEIQNLETQKSGNETRGRKKEKQFVEMIFSLTNTEPTNENLNNRFAQAQAEYLKMCFGNLELVTNVVHLDQNSLHAHAIFKIPKGKTWTECVLKENKALLTEKHSSKKLYDALKQAYKSVAHHFQNFMAEELNIKFNKLKNGVFYKSLSKYKKETGFNSNLKATEAPIIKKQPLERENIPLEQKKPLNANYEQFLKDLEDCDKELEEMNKILKEEEQPRSTELHHDDETGSSHDDVVKAKRRRARS